MRIPWQNNGPRILLSLSLLFPCSSITPLDGSRQTPSVEGSEVERTKRCARESKHPRAVQTLHFRARVRSLGRSTCVGCVDYIGTCAVASQPAARQNYTNRGVALSTAWYLVAYGTVRIARYYPPCLRVLAGPSRFFADQVCLFFVPCFLNSWNWWLFVRGLCRV